jgi:hypothetical protein
MTTLTLTIDDKSADKLRKKAEEFNLDLSKFIEISIEDLTNLPDPEFDTALAKVLKKNRDLYDRLA